MNKHQLFFLFIFLIGFHGTIQAQSPDKVALLIGVSNYSFGSGWSNTSATNDLKLLDTLLQQQGFLAEHISIIENEAATKKGMLSAIKTQLLNKVQKGGTAVFHFSGHGQQIVDNNGDEVDGYDEALVPYDSPQQYRVGVYEGEKLLRDEEFGVLLQAVRQKLGKNGHLLVTIDACHSGTATRGLARTRGTDIIMADSTYIAHQRHRGFDTRQQEDEPAQEMTELASMLSLFSSSPNQRSFEYTTRIGKSYGLFTYALSRAFQNMTPSSTYQELFAYIQLEMSGKGFSQQAQIEGQIQQQVLGGDLHQKVTYFDVEYLDKELVLINSGELNGLHTGTDIVFYPLGTIDTVGIEPIARGQVSMTDLFTADVVLNQACDKTISTAWAMVRQRSFGKLSIAVQLQIPNQAFKEYLTPQFEAIPLIQLVEQLPDILIEMNEKKELKVVSKDDIVLANFSSIQLTEEEVKVELLTTLEAYLQASYLRGLSFESNDFAANFTIIKNGQAIPSNNLKKLRLGDVIELEISNVGKNPFYYTVLDIQPDNQFTVLLPFDNSPTDYYLKPGESYRTDLEMKVGEPLGQEVLKLLLTKKALSLRNVIHTRGSTTRSQTADLHPLEILVGGLFLEKSATRGGRFAMGSDLGMVGSLVFEIGE